MPAAEPKKSAQEQKDENLEKQLQKIRDDIVYLRENAGPNGNGLSDDYVLGTGLVMPEMKQFSQTSVFFKSDVTDGLGLIQNKFKKDHKNAEHGAALEKTVDRIDDLRINIGRQLLKEVGNNVKLLLNKENNLWENIDATRWKKTFDDNMAPLLQKIDAEIKVITEEKNPDAYHYADTAAGKAAYEAAKTAQIKLLEDYKTHLKKEIDQLQYKIVLDAIQNKKFRKKNNSGLDGSGAGSDYGNEITLQEHAREQLMLRTQLAIDSGELKSVCEWKSKSSGGVVNLMTNSASAAASDIYKRNDRWQGLASYFSWNSWMDTDYTVNKDGVKWQNSSYWFSTNETINQEIDNALAWFNKQTGKQDGFLNADKNVSTSYLLRLAERACEKGYKMQLTADTRKMLTEKDPLMLQKIDNALGAVNPAPGIQILAQPPRQRRM